MLRKISILLSFLLFLLFFGFNSYAKTNDINERFDLSNPYEGFTILYGDMNISSDLIYKIRYSVKDTTDDIISGEIIYQYEILGDSKYNGYINVIYRIEDSLGKELKVMVGSTTIYDLVFDEYASIYECNVFDFTDYSDRVLRIGNFSYTENYLSNDSESIALVFQESTKLDFLLAFVCKKGINWNLSVSNIDAKDINELYSSIKKSYGVVLDYEILESNYSPINNEIKKGSYKVKIISKNEKNELHIDKLNITVYESAEYFYCDDIKVNYDEPISDETIFKYYVHLHNIDSVYSYSVDSSYKKTANKEGTYDYTVTIVDGYGVRLTASAKIIVGDFKKPLLKVSIKNTGDGTYLLVKDMFEYSAYDNKDLDVTSNIKVFDIDDYEHNYNKSGTYRFMFSVKDNNENETTKLVEYTVINEPEVVEEPNIEEPINNDPKEEEVIKPKEEAEEIKKPEVIKYEFYTDNETPLTREMLRQKLIFSGFYKENDNFSMTSEYFENKDKNGTYLIYVHINNDIDCYSITVKDKEVKLEVNDEDEGFDYRFIVIGGIIVGVLVIGIGYLIIKKIKNKK